jgi:hypothetical protein
MVTTIEFVMIVISILGMLCLLVLIIVNRSLTNNYTRIDDYYKKNADKWKL